MAGKNDAIIQAAKAFKEGDKKPIYFIEGEEPFFIDLMINTIAKHSLSEDEKEFNFSVLYGRDTSEEQILSAAKRYPMMSQYNVVIVKEAQNIREFKLLESYVLNPNPTTILAIAYNNKKLDKRKSLAKALKKNAVYLESYKLYDNQVAPWIESYAKDKKLKINPVAVKMMADHQGSDLSQLAKNIEKLYVLFGDQKEVTPSDIERNIGISREYNIFEFQNAIGKKDAVKVYKIADYFGQNPKNGHPILVIEMLYTYFSKVLVYHAQKDKSKGNLASKLGVNPFFIKDYETAARNFSAQKAVHAMNYLRKYDLMSKGKGGQIREPDILKELSFTLMNI